MGSTSPISIEGLILCGGRAERMGGIDKGLIHLRDQALVTWVAKTLQPQVTHMRINANRHLNEYQALGFEVITDDIQGFAGPLAGFHAGLKACMKPYLLVVPCDSPLLPKDLAIKMLSHLDQNDLDLVYAATPKKKESKTDSNIQTHPVFCLMKKTVLSSLEKFLDDGERKIDRWFKLLNTEPVIFDDEAAFENINTPEELEQLTKSLA